MAVRRERKMIRDWARHTERERTCARPLVVQVRQQFDPLIGPGGSRSPASPSWASRTSLGLGPRSTTTMLITKTYHDVPSKLDANGRPIRIFVIAPTITGYPNAKFPGRCSCRLLGHVGDDISRRGMLQVQAAASLHSVIWIESRTLLIQRDLPSDRSSRTVCWSDR